MKKLTIELVPRTCWYGNVRSNVSRGEWDIIRRKCYEKAENKCEVCGDTSRNQGKNYDLEAHEIWDYDDITQIQKLVGIIGLCNHCHTVKHPGLAKIQGKYGIAIYQLMHVNNMTIKDTEEYIQECFKVWDKRSEKQWTLDITFLNNYLNEKTN